MRRPRVPKWAGGFVPWTTSSLTASPPSIPLVEGRGGRSSGSLTGRERGISLWAESRWLGVVGEIDGGSKSSLSPPKAGNLEIDQHTYLS
jgi:hypothetical protein